MFLAIRRTLKQSFINFWRNGWFSISAVNVLILSLYVIGAVFILTMVIDNTLKNVEGKMNISVYFKLDTKEEKISEIKKDLQGFSEISKVEYVSREKALEDFKKNNADEPVIMKSLEEIGGNPLLASLVIRANNPEKYQMIYEYINNSSFNDDISRVNYLKNKKIIDKLNSIVKQVKKIGLVLAIVFGINSILIIFNTIRITIYTHKQEIEVMRLVGSSNMYIRLPFIFEGVLYGIIASILASILLFITIKLIDPYVSSIIIPENLLAFYKTKIMFIFAIQLASSILLGMMSSWIAMGKHLKI